MFSKFTYNISFKAVSIGLACLFLCNTTAFADVAPSSSLLSPHLLFADANKSAEARALAICKLIEGQTQNGESIKGLYLDDLLLWANSTDPLVGECEFEILPYEIRIHIPKSSVCVRYYDSDPEKAKTFIPYTDTSRTETTVVNTRINRQIFYKTLAVPTLLKSPPVDTVRLPLQPANTNQVKTDGLTPMGDARRASSAAVRAATGEQNVPLIVSTAPRRLTIDECRQRLLENLRDLRSHYPYLRTEFASGLEILKSEGVEAFEKKSYPKIKEATDRIKLKVDAIRTLPAVFGFSEPEMRERLNTFLGQIAEEAKVDKALIWFGRSWTYDFTYTYGFSEEELIKFHRNRNRDKEKALLKDYGMTSVLYVTPDVKKWVSKDTEDNYITIVIGRSEECAKAYGELSEQDRQALTNRLNALIDDNAAPWWGIRDYLKKNRYYDFDVFMMILRHNGSVDILDIGIFPFIYSHIQHFLDQARANASENQKWLDRLTKGIEYFATEVGTLERMDTFLQILDSGTDFQTRNITPYVHNRVESFRQEAEVKGLTFTTELSDEDMVVSNCDLNLLGVLIDNLIQNAIKYTTKGDITVRLTRKMMKPETGPQEEIDSAVLEVEDTGIGIPQDEAYKIFKRGYRASNAADIQGTGIGLDVVNIIVYAMRGDIRVCSEPGEGATFTVRLPIEGRIISAEAEEATVPSKNTVAYDAFLRENIPLIETLLQDSPEPILLPVPIEAIEYIGEENFRSLLNTIQRFKNCYPELYYASGTHALTEEEKARLHEKYEVERKPLPQDFERKRENILTLFPILKGEELTRTTLVRKLSSLDLKPQDTVISPIGLQRDPLGLIRAAVFGLNLIHIARHKGRIDNEFIGRFIEPSVKYYQTLCESQGVEGFNLTNQHLIDLATGDDNELIRALKALIELMPILPTEAADEVHQTYKSTIKTLISL